MKKTSEAIRNDFLNFFRSKAHEIVPSASLVPESDPTLLFTNAGMNQFKDVFLGTGSRPYVRAADTQKCLRVSGKHNDLEEVGIDTYHHTFFEMLGNWSFGDYFKREAIQYAWELLVGQWGMDPDRLYATVHEGDPRWDLAPDREAADLWTSETSLDPSHVLYFGSKDNFWMMGDTGPCGPCSEIHIDLRPDEERADVPGHTLVNADDSRVMEIWNLVFIQYNALPNGTLQPLAAKHVDTGMGFERVVAVLQGKSSTYDTDLFAGLLQAIADLTPLDFVKSYDDIQTDDEAVRERIRIAMRVIADHVRTIAFAIADGAMPGNEGRGYVIRRILRRAVRYGYQTLELKEPFLYRLVKPLQEKMGHQFSELYRREELILKVTRAEEEGFLRTLASGLQFFEQVTPYVERFAEATNGSARPVEDDLKADRQAVDLLQKAYSDGSTDQLVGRFAAVAQARTLPGEVAFLLHDTYGFPVDLTQLMAREKGLQVDMGRYTELMQEQKDRARAASDFKGVAQGDAASWTVLGGLESQFLGYEDLAVEGARIVAYRAVETDEGPRYELVLDRSPFYAESGGQIGDTGVLTVGGEDLRVLDTQKLDGVLVHRVDRLPADPEAQVKACVDTELRREIRKHHTATHLLHAALREHLGAHVTQKGSLVAPDRLRFDFSHFERVTPDQLQAIEGRVNEWIQQNIESQIETGVSIDEARARGAMMLFGEKYGDQVRMVTFDPSVSVELCGGTHVDATGEIGLFQVVSEGSVASGIRRVEAVAGRAALDAVNRERETLEGIRAQFRTLNRPLEEEVADVLHQARQLEKEVAALKEQAVAAHLDTVVQRATDVQHVRLAVGRLPEVDMNTLRNLGEQLRNKLGSSSVGVLGTANEEEGKVYLVATVSDDLVGQGLKAGDLVGPLARQVGGGGGGRPTLATAGGRQPEHLDAALASAADVLTELLT